MSSNAPAGAEDSVQVLTYHLQIQMRLFLHSDAMGNVTFPWGPEESGEPRRLSAGSYTTSIISLGHQQKTVLPPPRHAVLGCRVLHGLRQTGGGLKHRTRPAASEAQERARNKWENQQRPETFSIPCRDGCLQVFSPSLMSHSLEKKKHDLL